MSISTLGPGQRWLAALIVLAALAPSSARAEGRLAVLTPTAPWSSRCADAASRGHELVQERCGVLDTIADEARAGALAILANSELTILTRENTAQLLNDMGGACVEGECEVETARLIGADYVISGNVSLIEGTWTATLKMHAAKTARLLATTPRLTGATLLEVVGKVRRATEEMIGEGLAGGPRLSSTARRGEGWWYFDVAYAVVRGAKPIATTDGWRSPDAVPGIGAVRVGYRLSPKLAVEVGAEVPVPRETRRDTSPIQGVAGMAGGFVIVGLAHSFTPWAHVALGAGGGVVDTWVSTAGYEVASAMAFAPAASGELRLSLPIRRFDLGVALGATAFYLGSVPPERVLASPSSPNAGPAFRVNDGIIVLPRASGFFRVTF